ncbi:hypothetical protein RchiOBHm_Chr7g0234261 [Rosa chinensis]|uniref:Uncharacterized protein n=1 Tax=Rosa chinensis TaxID=74649 RepID=A0A2P6PGD4_ROSCH|nr:hypothetical protein RchiOBHm_Chr7g0234261 [Rosa chinensis]
MEINGATLSCRDMRLLLSNAKSLTLKPNVQPTILHNTLFFFFTQLFFFFFLHTIFFSCTFLFLELSFYIHNFFFFFFLELSFLSKITYPHTYSFVTSHF